MDVKLLLKGTEKAIDVCSWFRGHRLKMFAILTYLPRNDTTFYDESYTGRESVQRDCSLYIKNVTLTDSDFYSARRILEGNVTEFGTLPLLIRGRYSWGPWYFGSLMLRNSH